jgi:hypothetical protein
MAKIGGKTPGMIQACTTVKNEIGEAEKVWADEFTLRGWLGMQSGDSKYTSYNAKVEESTHVFLCDYHSGVYALADRDTRMIIKGFVYDVLLIDNPDEMDAQLEIYLKKVGAWCG